MQFTESVIAVCFNTSLLKYGGDLAVGAMTILITVMQFAMLPMQGLTQGAQPIISYNFGAGSFERVKKTFRLQLTACLVYSAVLWTSIFLAVLRKLILLIPLIFILPRILENQVMAVFLAEPAADFCAVCTTGILFFRTYKNLGKKELQ